MSQSIAFYEVSLIVWMDAKSIHLTCRIMIYGLNKKLNLEKILNLGEKVGILIFTSLSERHQPLSDLVFIAIKKSKKKVDETSCLDQFHSNQVLEPFICRICLISTIDSIV